MSPVVSDRPTIRNGRIVGTRVHFWRAGLRASNGGPGEARPMKPELDNSLSRLKRSAEGLARAVPTDGASIHGTFSRPPRSR